MSECVPNAKCLEILFGGSPPILGSIFCLDVCRFDLSRIPSTWLASSGPDAYLSPEEVVQWRGVARGTDGCVHKKHCVTCR